jgi:hypothetical protein
MISNMVNYLLLFSAILPNVEQARRMLMIRPSTHMDESASYHNPQECSEWHIIAGSRSTFYKDMMRRRQEISAKVATKVAAALPNTIETI